MTFLEFHLEPSGFVGGIYSLTNVRKEVEQCVHVSAVSAMFHTAACTYYFASSVQISYMQQMPVCTYISLCVYTYTYTYTQ